MNKQVSEYMKLTLTLKQQYGNNRYFPANETARIVCKLIGCISLTEDQLKMLASLGAEIEVGLPVNIQRLIGEKS